MTSILSRLGAGYSIATGSAWIALVPVHLARDLGVLESGAVITPEPGTTVTWSE